MPGLHPYRTDLSFSPPQDPGEDWTLEVHLAVQTLFLFSRLGVLVWGAVRVKGECLKKERFYTSHITSPFRVSSLIPGSKPWASKAKRWLCWLSGSFKTTSASLYFLSGKETHSMNIPHIKAPGRAGQRVRARPRLPYVFDNHTELSVSQKTKIQSSKVSTYKVQTLHLDFQVFLRMAHRSFPLPPLS